ncbi:hypothetical protein HOY80DRAFT_999713 [Tuber brumale]|nr:hypothetical protein HOY80DRAFT_999713 [Tuber brumale]
MMEVDSLLLFTAASFNVLIAPTMTPVALSRTVASQKSHEPHHPSFTSTLVPQALELKDFWVGELVTSPILSHFRVIVCGLTTSITSQTVQVKALPSSARVLSTHEKYFSRLEARLKDVSFHVYALAMTWVNQSCLTGAAPVAPPLVLTQTTTGNKTFVTYKAHSTIERVDFPIKLKGQW